MALTNQQLAELAGLQAGRWPTWETGDVYHGDTVSAANGPGAANGGIPLQGAQMALVCVDLHEDASAPRAWVTVGTVADSTLYRVTINGTNLDYTSDGSATLAEILAGVAAAVEAGAEPVSASVIDADDDGTDDTVLIVSTDGAAHTYAVSANLAVDPEATAVEFRVWAKAVDDPNGRWRVLADTDYSGTAAIDENWMDLFRVSGLERVYVEILSTDGRCTWSVAPSTAEQDT